MQESVGNPYRAPRADVDDLAPVENDDRGPRPNQVAVAVVMFWVVLIIQVASLVYNWQFIRYGHLEIYACPDGCPAGTGTAAGRASYLIRSRGARRPRAP